MPFLLGSGSQCDVCLETFSAEERAPCSIECGHVFCLKCLNSLTRSKCPLCRQRFDPRSLVKLHIDVDEVRSPSRAQDRPGESEDDLVAKKFQERIAAAANEGTTEQAVRQLIDECKSFLSQQPRNNFSDLRVSLRMISYVCDIKTKLLVHRQEVKHLTDETEKLQATISNMQDDMTRDRENWQALEMNLRDYCSKAQGAYFGVAE
ncbi:hypothetical protein CPB85DRAFT_1217506 [Mucidula mucida]|nr:hypothetical protein CPB85DRAFT_1217506 [Mucidula mucida]